MEHWRFKASKNPLLFSLGLGRFSSTRQIFSLLLDNDLFKIGFDIATLIMFTRLALTVGPRPASEVDQQNAEERGAG